MSRAREAAVVLLVALVLGGVIGWLLSGGSGSNGTSSTASSVTPSASVSPSPSPSRPPSSAAGGVESSQPAPTVISSSDSLSGQPVPSGPSDVVSVGAVTVTVNPPTAKAYAPIEVSGTVEGTTPGTTLEFARKSGATLATTQVGRAGAYRLTVKLGRSGTFVVRAVDGTTVLASSAPFDLTIT
jgi:hypothetical protein